MKSNAIDLMELADEGARDLALQVADDQRVERTEVFEEHGQVWVRAYYIETADQDERTWSVVQCGDGSLTRLWFELEEV